MARKIHHPRSPAARANPVEPAAQSGFSLLEVLIALVLLSIGLLGLAALQTASLRGNTGALKRSEATQLSNSILDRMRANRVNAGKYNVGLATPPPSGNARAPTDVRVWKNQLTDNLPAGQGRIQTNGTCSNLTLPCRVTITVKWKDQGDPLKSPTSGSAQNKPQYYTVQTQI